MTSFHNTALYDIRNTAFILTLRAAVKHPMLDGVQALNIYMLAYVVP